MFKIKTRQLLFVTALIFSTAVRAEPSHYQLKIEAQPLAAALQAFAQQSGVQVLFFSELSRGLKARPLIGSFTKEQALQALLEGTGLSYSFVNDRTVTVSEKKAGDNAGPSLQLARVETAPLAQPAAQEQEKQTGKTSRAQESDAASTGIPEILVRDSKILNMDIRRTRDDAQPYVVFERETIERSGSRTLEDFFKNRLTMNTVGATYMQIPTPGFGGSSQINLRGLGTAQTLILVDGHRVVNHATSSQAQQSDLNGIPLAAVERVEILPTTASGIYGGSATGGVVNVILRRDYVGTELKTTYDNTFDSDSAIRRIDLSGGMNFNDGKTSLLVAGSYSDSNRFSNSDRDFVPRGRRNILANNPAFYRPPNTVPLGATTNIRSATSGVNLTFKNTNAPLGSQFTFIPVGYAGTAGDNGAALLANAGRYNLDMANTAQSGGRNRAMGMAPTMESLALTLRHDFSRTSVFLEGFASNNSHYYDTNNVTATYTIFGSAPNNPFNENIQVAVPAVGADRVSSSPIYERRVVGGAIFQLPRNWSTEMDYSWARSRRTYYQPGGLNTTMAANISTGAVDVLRDLNLYPQDFSSNLLSGAISSPYYSTLKDVTLRAGGPVLSLLAGAVSVSSLLEYRDEAMSGGHTVFNDTPLAFVPERSQTVRSVYLETKIPLVSVRNGRPGLRELELQIAGRRDDYTVKGSLGTLSASPTNLRETVKLNSTDPTLGLRYSPVAGLMLRASYGTGFLPPTPSQVVPTPFNLNGTPYIDPRRGSTSIGGLISTISDGNPSLTPEESESWSMGAVLTPSIAPALRLSVDYTRIEKDDNITALGPQTLIDNEGLFPSRVVRGPVPVNDPYGVGPIVFLDLTLFNMARAEVEAYDAQLDYRWDTPIGAFELFSLATWQTHYKTQLLDTAPLVDNVGVTSSNPLKFKANIGVTWNNNRGLTAGWSARYFDGYLVADRSVPASAVTILNQGGMKVPDQMYHDVFAGYRFERFNTMELQGGVRNVLNTKPPFDAALTTYYYSPYGDPRLASYYLTLKTSF